MPLTIQLQPSGQQTAFNLQKWAELLTDPELARIASSSFRGNQLVWISN
jgi:hypothetical protein